MSASYLLTDIGRGIIRNKISQSEKLILTKVVFQFFIYTCKILCYLVNNN